jgi:hypothetical protein
VAGRDVDLVRFTGGEHSGLVVEAPSELAARLPAMRFVVLAGGELFDPVGQRRIPGARVVRRTGESRVSAPSARRPRGVPARTADVETAVVDPGVTAVPAVSEVEAAVVRGAAPAGPDEDPVVAVSRPRLPAPGVPVFRSARTAGSG